MTIAASSLSRDLSSSSDKKPTFRGVKKAHLSLHKLENSKFKDLEQLPLNDNLLQSSSPHRRYMRRGSRTPMMFQIDAAAAMISHDPSLNKTPDSDRWLQSSTSGRRYMRRGSRTPMMFQLDAAAVISHDPSFDDDTISKCNPLPRNPMVPPRHPHCSPIMTLLSLQVDGTCETFHGTSETLSCRAQDPADYL